MRRTLIVLASLALCGCASLSADKAPGCHGALRPANPHGSVLGAPAPPTAVTPSAPTSPTPGACA